MEATDLMIGDWVYRPDCYCKVKEVRENGIIGRDHLRGIISFEELKPIPLTPEILKKNGFDNYGGIFKFEEEGIDIQIRLDKYVRVFAGMDNTCNFKSGFYVHKLQHALRMCGINKEIVL